MKPGDLNQRDENSFRKVGSRETEEINRVTSEGPELKHNRIYKSKEEQPSNTCG